MSRVPTQRTPPDQTAPGSSASPSAPRRRRLRVVLAAVAGALALLCLGGASVAYVLYDRATAPDRSTPDVVVDNYLRAYLVDRNDVQAQQYTCAGATDLTVVQNLRAEAERRQAEFHVVVRISWGALDRSKNGTAETVRTTLAIAGFADGEARSSRRETWEFDVMDQDGWRVCGARKVD